MKSIAIAVVFAALALLMSLDIQAAPPPAPTPISDNCEQVATIGILDVYFCETDYGDIFVNSFGFMMTEY
jgi:hypothetical protein